ncbi:MAG TPA: beta-ketoacyl synthase N-terminal-like domain-containing protein [Solirubrobacteraceae bacterium]|jgi:3-oxoacyl-[acyl-carrier-protein] synthase II|nr:beta-ketoacyl synthase N-terminal-like domain-containing protein [Solirubrobacteraceae bacterium]
MTALAVTGMGVVAPPGVGREAFTRALAGTVRATVSTNGDGSSPASPREVQDFDVRAQLGRKGTSSFDRGTSIALVACREALEDSALLAHEGSRERIGVSLGTTTGSLRSMSDYTRDTLVEERPYLVNPVLFPNTVINCASGQAAIRHGLHGANSTLAAGNVAFLGVMRHAERAVRLGHLDATLAGAVEELSPHRALWTRHARTNGTSPPPGEGAVVLVLERADAARAAGRHLDAELGAVVSGFCPGGEQRGDIVGALTHSLRQALDRAGVRPSEIALIAWSAPSESAVPHAGEQAASVVLGDASPERVSVEDITGDCGAASTALQVAAILSRHRDEPARDGQASLVFGWTSDGGLAAAVLRGHSRPANGAR